MAETESEAQADVASPISLATTPFARQHATWPDSQGAKHRFECFPPETPWVRLPAVFVLAKGVAHGEWGPLYVGEVQNLREDLAALEVWHAATRRGMNSVHLRLFTGPAADRKALAAALAKSLSPPLNGDADELDRTSVLSPGG